MDDQLAGASDGPLVIPTVLHLVSALILFVPALLLAGVIVFIWDLVTEGMIGRTGEGIGFIARGIQHYIAMAAALYLPTRLIKRSNETVVASITTTLVMVIFLLGFFGIIADPNDGYGLYDVLETVASVVGLIAAAVHMAKGEFN